MDQIDLSHFHPLWRELGLKGDSLLWHQRLLAAYAEPHRNYHNTEHLVDCLTELEQLRAETKNPPVVEFALWFHDAIYDPQAPDNEEKSAALAAECLGSAGAGPQTIAEVKQLILATKSHEVLTPDAGVVTDADLSILGKPPERFWRYEHGIEAEYAWVSPARFREKRGQILQRFLERPFIYHTAYSREKYELPARENLRHAIARLRG